MDSEIVESAADRWLTQGWTVAPGLIGPEEVEAALAEVLTLVPAPDEYHRDPAAARRSRGLPESSAPDPGVLPEGPDFRGEQFRWEQIFPFVSCPTLNRLCVHGEIVSFVRRCLGTPDIRLYQAGLDVKYAGDTIYDQPLHLDANHSYLPASRDRRWRHVEGFLYLTDVSETTGATRFVSLGESESALDGQVAEPWPSRQLEPVRSFLVPGRVISQESAKHIYDRAEPAVGEKGSFMAYGPQVLHRGAEISDHGAWRVILNVSFRTAEQEWVGFHTWQPNSTKRGWREFVAGRTPDELGLVGFPAPGHPIWDERMIAETAERYPGLDVQPWREALAS